jgi:hypothetical protein
MAKELHDRTLATTIADSKRFAFGDPSNPTENIEFSALKTLMLDSTWIQPTLATGYSSPQYHPFKYRLNKVGQLEIKGAIVNSGGVTTSPLTFPVGYRPAEGVAYITITPVGGVGANEPYAVQIDNSGILRPFGGSGGFAVNHDTHFNAVINL